MNTQMKNNYKPRYINPYLGGVLLGLLVLITVYITGRGLGASGAVKSTVVTTADAISPALAKSNAYLEKFISSDHSPMYNWLVFESLGIFFGGLLSGAIFGRIRKPWVEHSPKITSKTRLIFALLGGILFGAGSQFGRGCTSGAALSGSSTFALGGVIVMLTIFGTGYAIAWIFRKLWI
ncbi:hypothetical protein MNBD_BACTEROID07-438 [hydrothermal vent metagenome]|uniref:Uncharacterized protein n=1 Tax=hydrothermal vent metagenome TaxID=652676 RepID=A0A3B0UTR6_9ZZZZ